MKSVQNIHYPENKDTIFCRSGREGQSQSPVRAFWIPGFGKGHYVCHGIQPAPTSLLTSFGVTP